MAENSAVSQVVGLAKEIMAQNQAGKRLESVEDYTAKKTVDLMTAGFQAVLSNATAPPPQGDGGMKFLFEVMSKRMDQQHEMMMKLLDEKRTAAAGGGGDLEAELAKMEKLGAVLERFRGTGGGESDSWLKNLPQIVTSIGALFTGLASVRAAGAPAAAPGGYPAAGSLPAANPPATAAPSPAPKSPAAGAAPGEVDLSMFGLDPLLMPLVTVVQKAVTAFQLGIAGDAFAEAVEKVDGEAVYAQFFALGKEKIMGVLSMLPGPLGGDAIRARLPEVEVFVDAFLSYGAGDQVKPEAGGK